MTKKLVNTLKDIISADRISTIFLNCVFTGVNAEKVLAEIAQNCVHLQSLSVAYLGLTAFTPTAWPCQLIDLR